MDDKNFDPESAQEWLSSIESEKVKIREQDIYPALARWSEALPNRSTIVDIGCGQGACSIAINPKLSYLGVEPSDVLLQRARQIYPQKSFISGNVYNLPIESGMASGAFSIAVWHLLSDIKLASQELARILKQGGQFLIVTADPDAYDVWVKSAVNDVLHLHSDDSIKSALKQSGLEIASESKFRNQWLLQGAKR